ncbi:universal stress protein [Streptomyces flavofungini]|uniref:Universal stress protein n=1 Tax=Streptomyces flavofungini TaxID=68200 RepID=A0ABS0XID9_9ACTN|nr:universal stress protein [Streptomyces flavofungini]MBJ3812977.1 universal stress protein [Streptomyces flavofungini]GHC84237.1 universal stress protein [Streptomyces flavofungini]
MELPVVVGVDGSAPSLRAVDWAADEAALHGVPLRLVYASLWERYEGPALARALGKPSEQVRADLIVGGGVERAERRAPDLKISAEVLRADAVSALLREARNASMVVVASRGRSGVAELLLGSVSLAVAARASCPVVVLRDGRGQGAWTRAAQRIVLGVGDEVDSAAVRFAFQEAADRHAALHVVRAWRCPAQESSGPPLTAGDSARDHEQGAADLVAEALRDAASEHPSVRVLLRIVEGEARTALVEASGTADLLVVGARRQRGHLGLQLGRVTHTVLHHSVCPVAVVPQRT